METGKSNETEKKCDFYPKIGVYRNLELDPKNPGS